MILIDRTIAEYGYHPNTLSYNSHKRVIVQCELCGHIRDLRMQDYHRITKCNKCKMVGKTRPTHSNLMKVRYDKGRLTGLTQNNQESLSKMKATYLKKRVHTIRNSRKWIETRLWKKEVIARDKRCLLCGATDKLIAHHIKRLKDFPELRTDIKNGATLCTECHARKVSWKEKKFEDFLYNAIAHPI